MIHGIAEINFPAYATLDNATVTLAEMGDRFISAQVKIDGDIVPNFENWELEFRGERFILTTKEPQAVKDNSSRFSTVDLTFYSWPLLQMKRYFMFETTQTATGTVMASKYNATVSLNVADFCALLQRVLSYYLGDQIVVDLNPSIVSGDVATVEMNYTYVWDVLQKFYEMYGLRWRVTYDEDQSHYVIKVGYSAVSIDDHDFEYGYEGGLIRFERQVQDADIKNILLGRGGTQNVPYRYFKKTDPQNPGWAEDPDAIPELANVYFERIYDANFRWYIRGWMHNPNRDTSGDDVWDPGHVFPTYTIDPTSPYYYAYQKGATDELFDPVEYVKDDDSITKYGEKWGALDDNDEIYPTIQGIVHNGGRVDTVLAVSEIVTDDIHAASSAAAKKIDITGVMTQTDTIPANTLVTRSIRGSEFTVPQGMVCDVMNNGFFVSAERASRAQQYRLQVEDLPGLSYISIYNASTGQAVNPQGLTAGTYYYVINVAIRSTNQMAVDDVTYGVNGIYLLRTSEGTGDEWKPTFDIYVRNLFDSQQAAGETDADYALRVWQEILGDHLGSEAKIVFSDGFMSISEDYEFTIASYPVVDRSKAYQGFQSEWKITLYKSDAEFEATGLYISNTTSGGKITLYKSDAEFEATGLYIPNTTSGGKPAAGDHFFFIGIDMPNMYVTEAEQRVTESKIAALNQTAEVNPTWVVGLDKVRIDEGYNDDQERLFDKIDAGVRVYVKDSRFTHGNKLLLYINSVTFSWGNGTIVLPDTEIILTDKVSTVQSPVQTIQNDVNVLKSAVAQAGNVEGVVRQVTRPMYLGKTGDEQLSLSPTKFASLVTSEDFRQGDFGGQGWGFYEDAHVEYQEEVIGEHDAPPLPEPAEEDEGEEESQVEQTPPQTAVRSAKRATLEVDNLIVRREMRVNNIVVNQIAYIGGKQIISAAAIECIQVVERDNGYDCYFDQKQGTVKNLFRVGDIAMGQVFSADNIQLRFYKRVVVALGKDYIRLSKTMRYGDGVPRKGDVIVQYGNIDNPDRRYVIIRDVIGGGYEQMLSDLDTVYSDGVEYYFAGISSHQYGDSIPLMTNQEENLRDSQQRDLHVRDVAKPRFFVGDADSYVKYSASDRTIYLKGNIVQSPAGVEFPVPCYRGEYVQNEWYYYGDMVTYNGASWIHIGKNRTQGTVPSDGNIWRLYAAKGDALYRLDLTNDNASINADSSGNILPGSVRPTCTATMYYGNDAVQNVIYVISTPAAQNVAGLSINASTGVLTFNAGSASTPFNFEGNSLEITVTATYGSGANAIVMSSIMTVTKNLPGANGEPATSRWLVLSADKVSVNPNITPQVADPATVSAEAWLQIGEDAPRQAVAADGLTIQYKYDDGTYVNYTGAITVDITKRTLYIILKKGASIVDGAEAIPILYDGRNGTSPIFADIDNEMDGVVVNPDGTIPGVENPTTHVEEHIIRTRTNVSIWYGTSSLDITNITFGSGKPAYVNAAPTYEDNAYTGEIIFTINSATQVLPTRIEIPIIVHAVADGTTVSKELTYTLAALRGAKPGAMYKLVPAVSSVIIDPNDGSYSVPLVDCEKRMIYEGQTEDATDCIIKYQIQGSAAPEAAVPMGGVPTANVTTGIIFFLYFTADQTTYIDRETVPVIYDGLDGVGQPGKKGKTMRGITTWNSNGYGTTGDYQGFNDPTGDYYDVVIWHNSYVSPAADLFYQCMYRTKEENGTTYTAKDPPVINAGGGQTVDNPCWELMNNYENIATKALAASQALINSLFADESFIRNLQSEEITTKQLETATHEIKIAGNQITVKDSSGNIVGLVHSSGLSPISGGGGTTSSPATRTVVGQDGNAIADVNILGANEDVEITSPNNVVTIPNVSVTASVNTFAGSAMPDEWYVRRYATDGTTDIDIGTLFTFNSAPTSQTIPAIAVTLPVGEWEIIYEISCDVIAEEQRITATTDMGNNPLTVVYSASGAMNEFAGNGFRAIWSDTTHPAQGFEATKNGAFVYQDGTAKNAMASSTAKGIEFVVSPDDYPASMEDGILYIKLTSAS